MARGPEPGALQPPHPTGQRALGAGHPGHGRHPEPPRAGARRPGWDRGRRAGRPGPQPGGAGPHRAGRAIPGRGWRGRGAHERPGGHAPTAPALGPAGHAGPDRRARLGAGGPRPRRRPPGAGPDLPAVRIGGGPRGRRSGPARRGLLPRGRVGHRRPRHPRRVLSDAGGRGPAAWWSRSTTGWPPRTRSPPPWRTPWPPTRGCSGTPRSSGSTPGRSGVMGDSAGGNLAAVVALEARAGQPNAAEDVLPPCGPGPHLSGGRRPARHRLPALVGGGLLPDPPGHGAVPGAIPARPVGLDPGPGLAPVGRRPPGRGPGAGGHRGLRPPAGRRQQLRRGAARRRSGGRVPLLRRPDPRVHGHGHPSRVAGAGHRGLRRHGPAGPATGRAPGTRPSRTAGAGAPTCPRRPLQLGHGPIPWHVGSGWRRRVERGMQLRRRVPGRLGDVRRPGAAHRGRLRAPRAVGGASR